MYRRCLRTVRWSGPKAVAAGYSAPDIGGSVIHYGPASTTEISYKIFNPGELKSGKYRLEFSYPDNGWRSMPSYQVVDVSDAVADTIESLRELERLDGETRYFDGLIVKMDFDTSREIIYQGWQSGSKCELPAIISAEPTQDLELAVNFDFDIVFTEEISDTTFQTSRFSKSVGVPFYVYSPTYGKRMDMTFIDANNDKQWQRTEIIRIILGNDRATEPATGTGNISEYVANHV